MADIEIVLNKISLDIKKNGIQTTVHAKKGDIQSRAIIITFRVDGNNYRVADGVTAVIRAKKPDGTVIYNSATVQDGKVYFLLTSQYCAVAGKYTGEVQLVKSGKVLYTPKFAINVEDNIYDDSEIESTNEYTQLTEAIEDAQDALETAQNLQLIKYVTDLDEPGDEKYLYVLEEKKPYFTMTDFPTSASSAVIFETYGTVSNNYPFLAFTGMILQEETYSNPGVIEFRDWVGSPSGTDNAAMYGYKLSDEKWVLLDTFAYSGASALSQGDEIILTDEAAGTYNPVISNYKIKSDPLYEIGSTRVVYIYDNSETIDDIFYLVGRYSNQTYAAEDNVIDITDIPEILTNPTGIPYVYDEVTNQYVALLDATAESLLERMSAAEDKIDSLEDRMTAAEGDIDSLESDVGYINDELDFYITINHTSTNPTCNKNYNQINQSLGVLMYTNPRIKLVYKDSNNNECYAAGTWQRQGGIFKFCFNTSEKTKTETRVYQLNTNNTWSVTINNQTNQAKLTEGDNIEIDYTDPDNPVISATGGGGGSTYTAGDGIIIDSNNAISTNILSPVYYFSQNAVGKCNMTHAQIYDYIKETAPTADEILKVFKPQFIDTKNIRYDCVGIEFSYYYPTTIIYTFRRWTSHYQFKEFELQHTSADYIALASAQEYTYNLQQQLTAGDGISIIGGTISVDYDDGDSEEY